MNSATAGDSCDNASVERLTRGDPGLGADDSGPYSLGAATGIVRRPSNDGQLPDRAGPLRFQRFPVPVDR